MPRLFADITPLREVPAYRRLFGANAISNIGQQMAAVAVALQIWDLTHSSFMVGLTGLCQLVPIIGFGLYGGTLSDTFDRRKVGLISALGLWTCSFALLAQGMLHWNSVALLYVIIAVQSSFWAVGTPARQSIIPRLVPVHLLPAANALSMMTWSFGFTFGPLLGGLIIGATSSVSTAYLFDVVAFALVAWAMFRLPSLPPIRTHDEQPPRRGWAAVREGLTFLADKRNLQMTFYLDLVATVFGMPRALFPAIAAEWYGGTTAQVAFTLGVLSAGPSIGALVSSVLSGPIGRVRYQGRAIVVAILSWGVWIAAFGFTRWLPLAVLFLALAGASDNISAIFRTTIMQAATPDEYRGRLQGVYTVVVAGGPRLGDLEAGAVASMLGETFSVISGGVACVIGTLGLMRWRSQFWHYDANHPVG